MQQRVHVLQTAPPLTTFLKAPFSLFCSRALVIALINYISLVALETEVRECITRVERKKERKRTGEKRDGESGC